MSTLCKEISFFSLEKIFLDIIDFQRGMIMNKIEISTPDLQKLKIIGQGSEGTIYEYSQNELLKIYHSYYDCMQMDIKNATFDEDGVNVTPIKNFKNKSIHHNTIQYFDEEGVRLSRKESISRAIAAQKDIHLTRLPQSAVYVDGKLKGCSLYYHRHTTNIYTVMNIPLYRLRLKIIKKILEEVKELTSHHIYHIDLCQHPTLESKNTNILLTPFLEPQIIDIDGHSAIYSATANEDYKRITEFSLGVLIIELLSREYITEFLANPEDEELCYTLSDRIPESLITDFLKEELTLERMAKYL